MQCRVALQAPRSQRGPQVPPVSQSAVQASAVKVWLPGSRTPSMVWITAAPAGASTPIINTDWPEVVVSLGAAGSDRST